MTLLATRARLEAASTGRAQPLNRVRHRHLSGQPFVLIPRTLAGDPATPVAAMAGTSRTALQLLVVPQPRDRELRLRFLTGLARGAPGLNPRPPPSWSPPPAGARSGAGTPTPRRSSSRTGPRVTTSACWAVPPGSSRPTGPTQWTRQYP